MSGEKQITPAGLVNLFIVYFVWGSTYLAIRVGIRAGSGFEPFWFGGLRVLTAGLILILIGVLRKKQIRPSRQEIWILAAMGLLMWIGGNAMVILAERRVDSGLAALVVSSTPIWVAAMEAMLDKKLPSWQFVFALLVGFSGIVILSYPILTTGIQADIISVLLLIIASLSWSAGLVLQTRRPVQLSRGVSSGFQQLFGGIFYTLIALLVGEQLPAPTPEAWAAWGYLVVFGSLLAFTAFISALQVLPTSLVTTYAYVNPVIAVLLGWLILKEPITPWTVAGGIFVILGVMGIYRNNRVKSAREGSG